MVNGLAGVAALCLLLPYCWFQWGPGWALATAVVPIALVAGRRLSYWLLGALIAVTLLMRLEGEASHLLPPAWQHQTAELTLCLDQPPQRYDRYQSMRARVTGQPAELALRRLRLTADSAVELAAGDCVQASVRLRQPLGRLVPGTFNPTRYYFTERLDALGTLTELYAVASDPGLAVRLYDRAAKHFDDDRVRAVWAALALGWSGALDNDLDRLFEQNQVKHLMVVSGMHVGMVAAWALLLTRLLHRLPGPGRGRLIGLRLLVIGLATGAFVALTGFGAPGLRAWLMLLVPLAALALGVRLHGIQALAVAAVALSLVRPQAWLGAGTWLSFGLVWVLIRLYQRWRSDPPSKLRLAARMQLWLTLVMIPVAALLGFYWHPLSILINLVLIPLVTLLILPWSLAVLLVPSLAWVDGYQTAVLSGLEVLAALAPWHQPAPVWTLAGIGLLALGLWLLLTQVVSAPQRWLVLPLVALVLFAPRQPPAPAEFRLTALDVGHGQALVLQWPDRTWLYDTAGQWSNGQSVARTRLAAWFDRQRLEPDGILVSHGDTDHAGGAAWVVERWPRARRLSGEPGVLASATGRPGWRDCHGPGAESEPFRRLAVPESLRTNANNRSCVLLIPTSAGPVLITGDAGRRIEYWLLQSMPEAFPLALQVAGHHGSRTSSARALLDASPDAPVLVSAGDRSRPRWPNPELTRYLREHGRRLWNTAERGTLAIEVADGEVRVRDWRSAFRRRFLGAPE